MALADPEAFISIAEAAQLLRLSPVTVWRRCHDGSIPALQIGGKHAPIRIPRDAFFAWLYGPQTDQTEQSTEAVRSVADRASPVSGADD